MINDKFVVAYQDENNIPLFLVEHLNDTAWTMNPMLCEQFDTWQLGWDALKYVECTAAPEFGMVVMTYESVMDYTYKWLDKILDDAVVV